MPRSIEPDETLQDTFALIAWNSAAIISLL
jgi:hypothetical protein